MKVWRFILPGLLAFSAGACGGSEFWVTIEFPDPASRDRAASVTVYAIEPAADSTCDALAGGSASPGEPGYPVEGQVEILLPAQEQEGALTGIGPGRRLFFAEAMDGNGLVFLNGCAEAQAAGSGPQEVTIRLGPSCPDGQACDDGLHCTTDDRCVGGVCTGTGRDCSTLDDECHLGACDEATQACKAEPVVDGTACDDGQWCTVGDHCLSGVCSASPRSCPEPERNCYQAVCNEEAEDCENIPLPDGSACDDGLYCSEGETCQAQSCTGGQPRDCTANGGSCVDGVCDEELDQCVGDALPAGTSCDDQFFCTVGDHCDGDGVCQGSPRDCSQLDDACTAGRCDEAQSACVAEPVNQGAPCDDGDACTTNTLCDQGACQGEALDCSHLDDQCLTGTCDPLSGECQALAANQDAACDDGDPCSTLDTCLDGQCQAGPSNLDADQDSYIAESCPGGDDCDDSDPSVNPGASEGPVCDPAASCFDGKDNNCNELTDSAESACAASNYICVFGPENPVHTGAPGDTLTVRLDGTGYDPGAIVCYTDNNRLRVPEVLLANDFEADLTGLTPSGDVSLAGGAQNPASAGSRGVRICGHASSLTATVDTTGRQRILLRYAAEASVNIGVYLITEYSSDSGNSWYALDIQGDNFEDDDFLWFSHILPPACENHPDLMIRLRIRGSGFSDCADIDDFSVSDLADPTVWWNLYRNHFEPEEGNSTADICLAETIALFEVQSSDSDVCLLQTAQVPGGSGIQGLSMVDNDPTVVDFQQADTRFVPAGSDLVCSLAMSANNLGTGNYANAWYSVDGIQYRRMNGVGAGTPETWEWTRFILEPDALGLTDLSISIYIPPDSGGMDQTNGIWTDDFELTWFRASHDWIGSFSDQGDGRYTANFQSDLAGLANVTCLFYGSQPPLATDGQGDNSDSVPVTFFE